ncbi:MAG: hypothetical protein KC503_01610 [Myxococcales bacterium]|nr:hypothetical protein [Myxococcales bacterium]
MSDEQPFDPGEIEIGSRPARDADGGDAPAVRAPARSSQRTIGLLLVVVAGVALFVGGALIYVGTQRLPSRLPPPQMAQVLEVARGYLRAAAYAMMGGGFVALLGWRMLVAARRRERADG